MAHKTYDEIISQYEALDRTLIKVDSSKEALAEFYGTGSIERVVVLGCGSSFSVAKSVACVAELLLGIPARAIPAGDLMLRADAYRPMLKGSLIISLSRSGATDEIIEALLTLAKSSSDVKTLSVICAEETQLAGLSGLSIEIPWAFDESVCQTRSVTNLYGAAILALGAFAKDPGIASGIREICGCGHDYIKKLDDGLGDVARQGWSSALVLADAEAYGMAEEGALAFNEISVLPSMSKHMLDSRHGPMVLVNEGTLAIVYVTGDDLARESALVGDLVRKRAKVVVFSAAEKLLADSGLSANIVFPAALDRTVAAIPFVAISQMLAYKKAVLNGGNPDKPPGLDPWIEL
jgi:fructoselysine-6-P-deglycase FrlB-like protein